MITHDLPLAIIVFKSCCTHCSGYCLASRVPSQHEPFSLVSGSGGFHRRFPFGGFANGIPCNNLWICHINGVWACWDPNCRWTSDNDNSGPNKLTKSLHCRNREWTDSGMMISFLSFYTLLLLTNYDTKYVTCHHTRDLQSSYWEIRLYTLEAAGVFEKPKIRPKSAVCHFWPDHSPHDNSPRLMTTHPASWQLASWQLASWKLASWQLTAVVTISLEVDN